MRIFASGHNVVRVIVADMLLDSQITLLFVHLGSNVLQQLCNVCTQEINARAEHRHVTNRQNCRIEFLAASPDCTVRCIL